MALQTVKVHIKVYSLQGWVIILFPPWTDMEPVLHSMPALCLVQNESVLLMGLWLPNIYACVLRDLDDFAMKNLYFLVHVSECVHFSTKSSF